MKAVFRKEMADYFTSIRVFILFLLTLLVSFVALYSSRGGTEVLTGTRLVFLRLFTSQPEEIPAFLTFVNLVALFFVPVIGIALGFDAVNREHSDGTLSRILSQPVFRDNVINAKFLAGIITLSIMVVTTVLLVSGIGLLNSGFALFHIFGGAPLGFGVPPSTEEIIRLFIYIVFAIVYGAFWMGLAVLFSVLFRRISTSLLFAVAVWLFFGIFYVFLIAPAIANSIVPITDTSSAEVLFRNAELQLALSRVSPNYLFSEASLVLLQPPTYGSLILVGVPLPGNPLSLGQSLILVWPHLTLLIAVTLICFAISYVIFMRQEIRTT